MWSDTFARIDAFAGKAYELSDKGHLLRAVENFERAAEAARPLGADNLVTMDMQLAQGDALSFHTFMAARVSTTDLCILAAQRAECLTLLSGVLEALERRRAAGTLLKGKCSAAEEAWRTRKLLQHDASPPATVVASRAALVGYLEFVDAASSALVVLSDVRRFAAESSDAQFKSFAEHVVHAAELMQQTLRCDGEIMRNEREFTGRFRAAVAIAGRNGLNPRLVQLLESAWQRLQRSGVLHRFEAFSLSAAATEHRAWEAEVQKSMTAPDLRSCALDSCGATEAHPAHFKSCAACRAVVYCCREHQVAGWPAHKKACKAARKAAAKEDGAGPSGA